MTYLIFQNKEEIPPLPPIIESPTTLLNIYPQVIGSGGNGIIGIAMNPDGTMWLSIGWDQNDIRRFDPTTGTITQTIDNVGTNPRGLSIDHDGSFWAAIQTVGARKYSQAGALLREVGGLTDPSNVSIGGNGWIWVSLQKSVVGINPLSGTATHERFIDANANFVVGMMADSNGNVWVSTINHGEDIFFHNFATNTRIDIPMPAGEKINTFAEGVDGFVYGFAIDGASFDIIKQYNKATGAFIQDVYPATPGCGSVGCDTTQLLTDAGGAIWYASRKFNTTTFTFESPIAGLPTIQSSNVGGLGTVQSPITGLVYTVNGPDGNLYEVG